MLSPAIIIAYKCPNLPISFSFIITPQLLCNVEVKWTITQWLNIFIMIQPFHLNINIQVFTSLHIMISTVPFTSVQLSFTPFDIKAMIPNIAFESPTINLKWLKGNKYLVMSLRCAMCKVPYEYVRCCVSASFDRQLNWSHRRRCWY